MATKSKLSLKTDVAETDADVDGPRRSARVRDRTPGRLEPPAPKSSKARSRSNSKVTTPTLLVTEATPAGQVDLGDEDPAKRGDSKPTGRDKTAAELSQGSEESGQDAKSSKKSGKRGKGEFSPTKVKNNSTTKSSKHMPQSSNEKDGSDYKKVGQSKKSGKGGKGKASASSESSSRKGQKASNTKVSKHVSQSSDDETGSDEDDDEEGERVSDSDGGDSDDRIDSDHPGPDLDDDDENVEDDEENAANDASDDWITGRDLMTDTEQPYEGHWRKLGHGPARLKRRRNADVDADAMKNVAVEYPNVFWYDETNDQETSFEIMDVRERREPQDTEADSQPKRPGRTVIYDVTPSPTAAGNYDGPLPEIRDAYAASTTLPPIVEALDAVDDKKKSVETGWWLNFEKFKKFYGDIDFSDLDTKVSCLWATLRQNGSVEYAGFRMQNRVDDGNEATEAFDEYKIEGPASWIQRIIKKKIFDYAVKRYKRKVMRAPAEWRDAVKPIKEILRRRGRGRTNTKLTTLEIIEHEFARNKKNWSKNDKEQFYRDIRETTFASPPPEKVGRRRRGKTPTNRGGGLETTVELGGRHPRVRKTQSRDYITPSKSPTHQGRRVTAAPTRSSGSKGKGVVRGAAAAASRHRSPVRAGPSRRR